MFEHDFAAHEDLGASETLPTWQEQEIEQEAQVYELTPSEVAELEYQYEVMDSLPPAEAETYEQETVAMEDQNAEQTMQDTMDQAESFDQTLTDGE